MLADVLNEKKSLRKFLFIRGFLITDDDTIDEESFPFYNGWNHTVLGGYHFYTHPLTGFHSFSAGNMIAFILGHAYNPFTMEIEEERILERIVGHYGENDFYSYVNEITGVFVLGIINNGSLQIIVDPSGMQSACHGFVGSYYYLSSHPQLIADICKLQMDSFVKRLIQYKWYPRVMGAYLPADLTPFSELKRIVPNIEYVYDGKKIEHKRFYPIKELAQCSDMEEYQRTIVAAADILKKNMELISRKWNRPWISLTGGIDSNTTFAAANGIYDRFEAFSYLSAEKETIDAEAAKKIAGAFHVPWTLYKIPDSSDNLEDYDLKVEIIRHNNGYIGVEPDNELRKRVYLEENLPCDVEVKSWVSETIRAYWYKHYNRKSMPKLSGKLYRNLYKIFLTDRRLAHEIDEIFEKYIDEFEYRNVPEQYPPADLHYNEVTWGSWGGLNISEMKFYSDITFVYNNRCFLDLMFKIPLNDRISDKHHLDMKKYLNPELYNMNIRVVNLHETKFRANCLNAIFTLNMVLPF